MKYIITESKLDGIIYDFINNNFSPELDWSYTIEEIKYNSDGETAIVISDDRVYYYIDCSYYDKNYDDWRSNPEEYAECPFISMDEDFEINRMDDLFGDRWKKVFIKWFYDKTGIEVKEIFRNQ